MALAVASVGNTAYATSTEPNVAVTLDKPSGLAVGDLMVACIHTGGSTSSTTVALSGWTATSPTESVAETSRLFLLRKVADAGDVAASNFTFTSNYDGTGTGKIGGGILRVTGYATTTTPVIVGSRDNNKNATNAVFGNNGYADFSFTPADINSLVVYMVLGSNNETASGTFSAYAVEGTNLSWTEQFDIFNNVVDDSTFAVATAIDSTTNTRTGATATCSVAYDDYAMILASFQEQRNVTADISHLAVTPTIEGVTASVNVVLDIGHLYTEPTVNGIPTDNSSDRTPWTNPDKPSQPTWRNPSK